MSKRQRFVITSLILSGGFVTTSFLANQFKFWSIGGLTLLTVALFFWCLREGIGKNTTLLSLILPAFFTLGVGIFWFLLPTSIYASIPIVVMYAAGVYVLVLTMNIYTVSASVRTIALLRAAKGVGFVLTLLTSFLLFDAIFSLKAPVYLSFLFVFLTCYPLFLQGYWAVELENKFSKDLLSLSLVSSIITAQMAISLHFWPVTVVVGSLFLTSTFYMLLGLGQARLEGRLFSQTVREYLIVGVFVFIGMYFATRWG